MSTHENLHQGPKRLYNAFFAFADTNPLNEQKNSLGACKISFVAHCRGGGKDAIIKTEGDPTLPILTP